jgi:hypothetical protein
MPHSREELVELAEQVIELKDQHVKQLDMVEVLGLSQALISQLNRIKRKCCPQAFESWSAGKITTESAWDLSKMESEQQVERLNALTAGNRKEWSLKLSREHGRNKQPHLKELRALVSDLQNAEGLDADKLKGAIAALQHSAGELTREELLEKLQ